MVAVLLTIHTLVILALIGVVLLQRSEGGAVLSGGSFMTGRGTANALTRTTSILAAIFFATSLTLAIIAARGEKARSVVQELTGAPGPGQTGKPTSTEDLLKSLGSGSDDDATLGGAAPPAQGAPASGGAAPATTEEAPPASSEGTAPSPPQESAPAPEGDPQPN